ncbi:MAG: hypothetical protein LBT79_01615 [Elusimicrobiota bacterium]|jgi:hypothetical protein|nr:hypothetical protein [Elusimicrobiota bacterium]
MIDNDIKQRQKIIDAYNIDTKDKKLRDNFGTLYYGYKGQSAIDKILKEGQGCAPDAFYRKDLGNIALVWGDDTKGLCHIVKRRIEQGIDIKKFLADLSDVIENGVSRQNKNSKRFEIWKDGKMAVIDSIKESDNIMFVLTAFKRKKL